METARWEQVKVIFHASQERTPSDRAAFVALECEGDPELRREVESLLASHNEAADFMESAAFADDHSLLHGLPAGGRIGPYQLAREIGRGGMGVVYLAERDDGEFRQQVAVKLVKRGMDTELILSRFRHERQILAALDHPNIGRLLDGGTTSDGRPYFVMEFIDGESVRQYCESRQLELVERLALFREVCAAVHYAHQRLVVHRDLKPANILVTAAGTPKLLDFGIARLLSGSDVQTTAQTAQTAGAPQAMTPEYASPEQFRREPVTTLSDVYSLGVLLHELLTGRHPFDAWRNSAMEIAHAVVETEPARASTCVDDDRLRRGLRGDLDNIILKALRKDPAQRYASAEQLSEDIGRHLAGRPVLARPYTIAYRAGSFVRRNKLAAVAAGLVLASLIGGMAAATHEASIARAERMRAERRFEDVRRLATSFLFELHDAIRDLPGSTRARELLVRRALVSLDGLSGEAQGDSMLQRDLAAAYLKLGDVQGLPYTPNLGQTRGALASYRKALAILAPLVIRQPGDQALLHDLSVAHQRSGRLEALAGESARAVQSERRALSLSESLVASAPGVSVYRRLLAENCLFLGRAVYVKPDVEAVREGLALFRRSLDIREELLAASPDDLELQTATSQSLESIAYAEWRLGDMERSTSRYRTAIGSLKRAHGIRVALLAADPAGARARRAVPDSDREIAQLALKLGNVREAAGSFRAALVAFESLARQDSTNARARQDVAQTHAGLSDALSQLGDQAGAIAHAEQAVDLLERLHTADPGSAENTKLFEMAQATLARLIAARNDTQRTARRLGVR